MSEPNKDVGALLRKPFPPELVGKLPRVTCKACRDVRGACDKHGMIRCTVCGNNITTAHIHLDYVGHAAVTDRLLEADAAWSWKPAYRDVEPAVLVAACASGSAEIVRQVIANSPPLADGAGMWIELTVGGVTRLGYATDDRGGPDHMKMLVSDGIRNAAMRFGVALDLWSKEDLRPESPAAEETPPDAAPAAPRDWAAEARAITDLDGLLTLGQECSAAGAFTGRVRSVMLDQRQKLQKPATPMEVTS